MLKSIFKIQNKKSNIDFYLDLGEPVEKDFVSVFQSVIETVPYVFTAMSKT